MVPRHNLHGTEVSTPRCSMAGFSLPKAMTNMRDRQGRDPLSQPNLEENSHNPQSPFSQMTIPRCWRRWRYQASIEASSRFHPMSCPYVGGLPRTPPGPRYDIVFATLLHSRPLDICHEWHKRQMLEPICPCRIHQFPSHGNLQHVRHDNIGNRSRRSQTCKISVPGTQECHSPPIPPDRGPWTFHRR